MKSTRWLGMAAGMLLVMVCQLSVAEDGVSENAVLIGQSIGLTGPLAGTVREMNEGAQAYFAHVNKQGGIHGRRIELRTLDDQDVPEKAAVNARTLIESEKVFVLFQSRGTPQTLAILPEIGVRKVPLIAPSTGAESLHVPINRLVFNVRAKYQDEIVKAIEHFNTLGIKSIGLLTYEKDDALGVDGIAGFNKGMAQFQLTPAVVGVFPRDRPDVEAVAKKLIAAKPAALIIVSSGVNTVNIIKAIRAGGGRMQIMTLSNNASQDFIQSLGKDAAGIMVSQITPPPTSSVTGLGKEFQSVAKTSGMTVSYATMEGFMSAKVLVEGLRRAGRNLTREGLVRVLEGMQRVDLGGVMIGYGERDHSGSDFVELTLIGKDGRYVR